MTVWQENLLFLEKNARTLYTKMADFDAKSEPRTVAWDANKRMLRVAQDRMDIWLGSTMSVEREAEKLFAECDENAGLVVLLGIGNIKLLPEIRKYFKAMRSLVIIEPSRAIFKALLSNVPIKKVFSGLENITVNIVLDEEPDSADHYYNSFLAEFNNEYTAAVRPISYCQLFPIYKLQMDKLAIRSMGQKDLSVRTNSYFRYSWLVNHWRNLRVVAPDVSLLTELMQKLPVIIVSAGPSLKNNMHLLREIGDRALIIAVGSAMQILHRNGIVPHLRMGMDGGSLQLKLFNGLDVNDCPLLYAGNLYYETVDWYKDNCIQFMMYRGTTLHEYSYALAGLHCTSLSSGPSVANCAVFVALASGCRKIIVLGQDLCFTDNKMHADGTWMDNNSEILALRDKIPARNIFGEDVYTDGVFISIKTTMENIARWCKEAHYINATEGGLAIEGFENKRLSLVMQEDLPAAGMDVKKYIKDIQESFDRDYKEIYQDRLRQAVLSIKKQTAEFRREVVLLQNIVAEGVDGNRLRKVKKHYDKVRQNAFNKVMFPFAVQEEELAVNKNINGADSIKKKETLDDYTRSLIDYIDFSQELAEEYLAGEEKINLIFEL